MNLELHEAGHAVVADALGWSVSLITTNADGGSTRVTPPAGLSEWQRAYQTCVIVLSGQLAEYPGLSNNSLRQVLTGKDRRQFQQAWRTVHRDTNLKLKHQLRESIHKTVRRLLAENAAEVDALAKQLEESDIEGPGPKQSDPSPQVIANRAAIIREGWSHATLSARRSQLWGDGHFKIRPPEWTPPVIAVASIRPDRRYEE